MEHAALSGRPQRLSLLRGLKTLFGREHVSYRSRRRALRDGHAAQPAGGRAVPRRDPDPRARVDPGLGPAQPALQRWTARLLVCPPRTAAVDGGLVDRLGLEHATDATPARTAAAQHRRRSRGAPAPAPAPGLLQ